MKDFLRSIPKAVPAKDSMPGLLALVMIGVRSSWFLDP